MKNKGLIIALTAIVTVISAYFLSFSYISKGIEEDANAYAKGDASKKQAYIDSIWFKPVFMNYTYKEIKEQELQLGLDLQGGMHVVLEVSPVEIVKVMAGSKAEDPQFKEVLRRANEAQKSSQDKYINLFYKAYKEVLPTQNLSAYFTNSSTNGKINFETADKQVLKVLNTEIEDAIDRSFNILRSRIDQFGVVQPNIQKLQGSGRIQLELPGIDDPRRARKLLQSAAVLEFYNTFRDDEIAPSFNKLNDFLVAESKSGLKKTETSSDSTSTTAKTDSTKKGNSLADKLASAPKDDSSKKEKKDTAKATSKLGEYFVPLQGGIGSKLKDTSKVNALLRRPEVKALFPSNLTFLWGNKAFAAQDGQEYLPIYYIKKGGFDKAVLGGDAVKDSRIDMTPSGPGVALTFKPDAARTWKRVTEEASSQNPKRTIAIVLDNAVYSAPTVNEPITQGNCVISGSFELEEARDLANILKSGRMPAPTRIVEEAIVGPNLGHEAIQQGLLSMIAALGLVVLFMVMYYSGGGMIANLALLFNVLFVVGIMVNLKSVLTLPGIAGIVLTVGMAVDANVLIFERIREELRNGVNILKAVELGYEKAFLSIFDSNITTLLSGVVLFALGSGPVKGFATTLIIGIFCSFFSAVYISRVILTWLVSKKNPANVTFHTGFSKNLFQNLNFDYISKRKAAYVFSSALIIAGFISIVAQGGLNYGVDFAGGRSYIVEFKKDVSATEVREKLAPAFENKGTEVKTFGSSNKIKVTTSYLIGDETNEGDAKVEAALTKGLDSYKAIGYEILSSSKVGPTIADDIKSSSLLSLILALVGIFLYVAFRFKNRAFGFGGVIALLHDALMVTAFFALARWFGVSYEIDQVFVAAILTIVGYSINDTVVVFDRVREFTLENPGMSREDILNNSINHTMSRTIMTALTVFLVVVVLFVFGGEILKSFSFAMLVGVVFGSYSSIFIAVPIVLDFSKKDLVEPVRPVVIDETVA